LTDLISGAHHPSHELGGRAIHDGFALRTA
jgi:hypothetical protein